MIRSFTAVTVASCLLVSSSAFAQDAAPSSAPPPASGSVSASEATAPQRGRGSLGLLVGFGLNNAAPDGAAESINAYGLGIGLRGGYTFPFRLYVGGTFIYHLGYSKDVSGGSTSFRVIPVGPEVGYDFDLGPIRLRPFLGLGVAIYSSTVTAGNFTYDGGGSKAAFWPGVLAMYDVTDNIYVGLDIRYTLLTGVDSTSTSGSANSFGFYANAGYRF